MGRRFYILPPVVFGLVLGILEATLWVLGLVTKVRFIVPYAAADALVIFALTPILALLAARPEFLSGERRPHVPHYTPLYVKVVMISAAVFLIFVQIFVGTTLSYTLKIVLAFIGSLSFWTMFVSFISMVFYLVRRR